MTKQSIKIASRASNLALIQVQEAMDYFPEFDFSIVEIDSMGDKDKQTSLMNRIPGDFFTRELDEALLNGDADIAVHSAKDLPYPLRDDLTVAALLPATEQSDSLVTSSGIPLFQLPTGAVIGTSSPVRKAELLKLRPDLQISSIRGTIEERLDQLNNGDYDGVIVATCALMRLGLEHRITERLSFKTHSLQGHLAVVAKKNNTEIIEKLRKADCRHQWGDVTIAGFGPGDAGLLTLKAHQYLNQADTIFYDDLLDENTLQNYPGEKVYVGKRSSNHAFSQSEINEKLSRAALNGKHVVRLKGGDPLTFGRGIEEYHYLAERLVPASLIPGISSAMAAAADALVPLTARGVSSSVVFLSAHDLSKLIVPKADTLVFFMGASRQQQLAQKLINEGWNKNTPVAVVQNASWPNSGNRKYNLFELSRAHGVLESPVIILVGWTAASRPDQMPKKWMYTGTHPKDCQEDGMVIHTPLINIIPRSPDQEELNVLQNLSLYDRILFTSRYSVTCFFDWLFEHQMDVRNILHLKIDVIGKVTAGALQQKGLVVKPLSEDESSEGMLDYYQQQGMSGQRILLPRSDKGLKTLPEGLKKLGCSVTILTVYRNQIPQNIVIHNLEEFDGVVFSAPSTVERFYQIYGEFPSHLEYIFRGRQTRQRFLDITQQLSVTN